MNKDVAHQDIAFRPPIQGDRVEARMSQQTVQTWPESGTSTKEQPGFLQQVKNVVTGHDKTFSGKVEQTDEGKFITREFTNETISGVDLSSMHCMLMALNSMYIKEHVLLCLCEDKDGHISDFHKGTTVKLFDAFAKLAKSWGLQLPFAQSPELREQIIKAGLHGVKPGIITDHEGMMQTYESSQMLMQLIGQGANMTTNSDYHSLCESWFLSVGKAIKNLDTALKKCPCHYNQPLVRAVTFKEGILDRK